MTIKTLARMPYAQAKVLIDDEGNVSLISYTTKVCSLSNDGWLVCYGLYSATTRKHISNFMREYTPISDYYTAKCCYERHISFNIYSGEIKEL